MDDETVWIAKTGKLFYLQKLIQPHKLGVSFLSRRRFQLINFLIQKKIGGLGYGGSFLSKMKIGSRKVPYKK